MLSPRKVLAALMLSAGFLAASLTAPASAFAAEHTLSSPSSPSCGNPSHSSGWDAVGITLCGSTATAIGATDVLSFTGHFEFYGPHGEIGNSPDMKWFSGGSWVIPINQGAPAGSLWCVRAWGLASPGHYNLIDNNCVKI
ncbi:hypothetical protein ABH935_010270 [Catenulispora sp. GAS73]